MGRMRFASLIRSLSLLQVRQLVPTDVYDTYERLLLKASLDRHSDIGMIYRVVCSVGRDAATTL